MSEIAVTELRPSHRARWDELWRGYLDFYETALPPDIYARLSALPAGQLPPILHLTTIG